MTIAHDIGEERARLRATFAAAGPDAPTLLAAWSAKELASHLAAQDRFAELPAYLARSAVQFTGLRFTAVYRDRRRVSALLNGRTRPWAKSLEILSDPATNFVVRPRVAPITLWELVVHHEDVRRPNGLPRTGLPDLQPVLNWLLAYNAPRLPEEFRSESREGTPRIEVGKSLRIEGPTLEAVLWLSGRAGADLESCGSTAQLEQLRKRLRV